ncbi:MAG: PhzF family phenazine biosynthesis protein [Cytophagales bacterium]|nr:MAG: PhzF family phenazine biosynthesis protein [Cytophagales bacterium]
MQRLPFFVVNAFTDKQFAGNPASVVLLDKPLASPEVYQGIAAEMPTPETAFLTSLDGKSLSDSANFELRWFLPSVELKMCGHATLAATAILYRRFTNSQATLVFNTLYGSIKAFQELNNQIFGLLLKSAPLVTHHLASDLQKLIDLKHYKQAAYCAERQTLIVEVNTYKDLLAVEPHFKNLLNYKQLDLARVVLTTASESGQIQDFSSRCFCPWISINEDAVSAATHTLLAEYWRYKTYKSSFLAYQASDRGGYLSLDCDTGHQVWVKGKAAIVMEGQYALT